MNSIESNRLDISSVVPTYQTHNAIHIYPSPLYSINTINLQTPDFLKTLTALPLFNRII